ncbi:MAG: LysR family transcriptional regulator [Treponema sp.]|nr:LysR family transcriptional regulator [Treponema sp.]MCL2272252.1 LysR family transcriptional regulator [Treponema sp.]
MDLEMLEKRAAVIRQVRSFFDKKNYLELDTPLFSPDLIPESCLEVFETKRIFPRGSRKESLPLYLIPSPEIWMKKIITQHKTNVYQICKCFRNGEQSGHLHSGEFTMLEYYTMDADYADSLALTEELFNFLAKEAKTPSLTPPFERITVADAFLRYAGFDLFAAVEKNGKPSSERCMEKEAKKLGLDPAPGTPVSVLYDLIFIHAVEPELKRQKPVALMDYPAFIPCLAKKSNDGRTVERWELYYNGIELANCFSEETDPQKVKEFFISEAGEKEKNAVIRHKIDNDYWKYFADFPRCSGVAMGLDRLLMALTGKTRIDMVLPF